MKTTEEWAKVVLGPNKRKKLGKSGTQIPKNATGSFSKWSFNDSPDFPVALKPTIDSSIDIQHDCEMNVGILVSFPDLA